MSELEQTLNQVLSNPQMMQQIMSLAQSLGQTDVRREPEIPSDPPSGPNEQDMAMMRKVAGFASRTGVDPREQALLRALSPYVSRDRVGKLEKAMRAAKMAAFASSLLQPQSRR